MLSRNSLRLFILIVITTLAVDLNRNSVHAQNVTISDPFPTVTFDDTDDSFQWSIFAFNLSFDIFDGSSGVTPFSIRPGAPQASFFLDSAGSIGLGTVSPQRHLHLRNDDTPAIRLEQTDAIFPAQTFDIGADSVGFFISDPTANTFPVNVAPAAPDYSLCVGSNGNIGLGTKTPQTLIDGSKSAVTGNEALFRFAVSDDSVGRLELNNATSTDGLFIPRIQGRSGSSNAALINDGLITNDTGTNPVIVYNAAKTAGGAVVNRPLVVYRNNNAALVTFAANGNITATNFITASSRSLKDKIVNLDSARASDALRQLTPVEYVYKDDPTSDLRVGFIAEDVPEIIAEPERKSVPVMDVVALVTRVVKDQQQTIEDQKATIARQQQELNAVSEQQKATNERLARLEKLLAAQSAAQAEQ